MSRFFSMIFFPEQDKRSLHHGWDCRRWELIKNEQAWSCVTGNVLYDVTTSSCSRIHTPDSDTNVLTHAKILPFAHRNIWVILWKISLKKKTKFCMRSSWCCNWRIRIESSAETMNNEWTYSGKDPEKRKQRIHTSIFQLKKRRYVRVCPPG